MAAPTSLRSLLLVVALGLVAAGCTAGEVADPAPTKPATSDPEATEAFCAEMERLDGERPESYVGSEEHVEDVEALLDVAPVEIRGAVEEYRDFLASGAVTDDDPASKETDGWPEEVRTAIATIEARRASLC